MPTYEYRCERCGDTVEVVQSFSDSPLTACARCGGPLRKVYAPVGIVFKGSGFYKTDSRASTRSTAASKPETTTDAATGTGSGEAATKEAATKEVAKDGKKAPATTASSDPTPASAKATSKSPAAD